MPTMPMPGATLQFETSAPVDEVFAHDPPQKKVLLASDPAESSNRPKHQTVRRVST